jgi:hypothetical protein
MDRGDAGGGENEDVDKNEDKDVGMEEEALRRATCSRRQVCLASCFSPPRLY